MSDCIIGLDIGGTKCAAVLASVGAEISIIRKLRFDTCAEKGFQFTFDRLCAGISELLETVSEENVPAIGISCGGPLSSREGIVLSPPHLPGWDHIPITKMLTERFHLPAYLLNDANACALVEWKLGAGRGTQNMVFLTMGTGMGGGIIANGALVAGADDMAGEVGHIRMTEDGPIAYGKAGASEAYVSGDGMTKLALALTEQKIQEGNPPAWVRDGINREEITLRLLAEYARRGDTDAQHVFSLSGSMLGRLLAQLADTLNPEVIVIGSVFVRCEDLLRPSMEKALLEEALPETRRHLRVVPAQTGEEIGDLASVMTALYMGGIDTNAGTFIRHPDVSRHFERLFSRYPKLEGCRADIRQAYQLLRDCFRGGGKLLICGNGGSCADAQHIAGELMKGFYLKRPYAGEKLSRLRESMDSILPGAAELLQQGLPVIVLTDHQALSTATQNDQHPLLAMAQQAAVYGRKGDVLLGISTSGNAKNVLLAASAAKALGLSVLALTGESGGKLKACADCTISVPASSPADVQEYHLPVYHTLCAMLESGFFTDA